MTKISGMMWQISRNADSLEKEIKAGIEHYKKKYGIPPSKIYVSENIEFKATEINDILVQREKQQQKVLVIYEHSNEVKSKLEVIV